MFFFSKNKIIEFPAVAYMLLYKTIPTLFPFVDRLYWNWLMIQFTQHILVLCSMNKWPKYWEILPIVKKIYGLYTNPFPNKSQIWIANEEKASDTVFI